MIVRLVTLAVVVLTGCGPAVPDAEPSLGSESSTGTQTAEPTTTSTGGETTDDSMGFLDKPDLAWVADCDTWLQNCPAGHKCTPYATRGGYWDRARCVPVVEQPDRVGEPCVALWGATTGLDSCEFGAWCLNVDPETLVGDCVAFCTGDPPNYLCEDPDKRCGGHRRFPTCIEQCCPIEQDCEVPGHGCYWEDHGFHCKPNAAPDAMYADACEFLNVCPPGTFCANPDSALDCPDGAAGCCQPFCRLGSDDCALYNVEFECVPWFEGGDAPPGYELTGWCRAAQ